MKRRLYIWLLRLHPPNFRQRFGDEMLGIFDEVALTGGALSLLADAFVSLWRQWLLRPEFRTRPLLTASGGPSLDGVPAFPMCASGPPRTGALICGGGLAVAAFAFVLLTINYGSHARVLLIGSHHPSPSHLLPAATHAEPVDLNSEIKVKPYPDERPLSPYFKLIAVLAALDADRDGIISERELANAPAALRRPDADHNGKLSPEECGGRFGGNDDPQLLVRARHAFMRIHPALAVLDMDRDAEISAVEIRSAPLLLSSLDRNGDGRLMENELLPDPTTAQVIVLMTALDQDADGRISKAEASSEFSPRIRQVLSRADSNIDGFVTEAELAAELLRIPPAASTRLRAHTH